MNRDGFHEKVRKGLSKENNQGDRQNMKEKNSLQELLYGNTEGMKSFSQYRRDGEILDENTKD